MLSVISVTTRLETQRIIKNVILAHSDSYRLLGQFSNSIDALSISYNLKPDIIILSDKMYFIGLNDFIRILTMRGIQASYIVLEHKTFNGVPSANNKRLSICIQETDVNEIRILDVLAEAGTVKKNRIHLRNIRQNALDTSADSWMKENHLFSKIISGQMDKDDQSSPVIQCQHGYLLIAQLFIAYEEFFSFLQILAQNSSVYSNCKALLDPYQGGNVFIIQEDKLCIWFHPPANTYDQMPQILQELGKQLKRVFGYQGSNQMALQCSDHCIDIWNLPSEYRSIDHISKYRFFVDYNVVLSSNWLKQNSVQINHTEIQEQFEALNQSLEALDRTVFKDDIEIIFYYASKCLSFNTYSYIWNQFIFWYHLKIQKYKLPADRFILEGSATSFQNIKAAKASMEAFLLQIFDAIADLRSDYNFHIEKSITYLQSNIKENISLTHLAEVIHVNPSYLSALFRQETGKTFVEIKTEIKINFAKELLLDTYKIYEVALMVGFENEKYFSRTFKKLTGINPREYQVNGGKNEKC